MGGSGEGNGKGEFEELREVYMEERRDGEGRRGIDFEEGRKKA